MAAQLGKRGMFHAGTIILLIGLILVIYLALSGGTFQLPDLKSIVSSGGKQVTGMMVREPTSTSTDQAPTPFSKHTVGSYIIDLEGDEDVRSANMAIIDPTNYPTLDFNAICKVDRDHATWLVRGCKGFYAKTVSDELQEILRLTPESVLVQPYTSNPNPRTDFLLFEGLTTSSLDKERPEERIESDKEQLKSAGVRILTVDFATSETLRAKAYENARSIGAIPYIAPELVSIGYTQDNTLALQEEESFSEEELVMSENTTQTQEPEKIYPWECPTPPTTP